MVKVRMSELTGGEARAEYPANPVILLPMGSYEDQGPHAPMGDYLLADAIAERIARRASERGTRTLVAPAIPYGGADYFGSMPGAISLGQATLRAVIGDMLGCLLRHKLTRIVVINGHAGNSQAIDLVLQPGQGILDVTAEHVLGGTLPFERYFRRHRAFGTRP